jgi:hypothetical protein
MEQQVSFHTQFDPEDFLEDPYFPPLTNQELDNCKAEMQLIDKFNQGDKPAIANFKRHLFSKRGDDMETLLTRADFGTGKGPDHWEEASLIFQSIITQDPTFLEPQAHYAKLLCLMGWLDEARRWAQHVLDSKLWHFVTIQTMVAVYTAKGDSILSELLKARQWPMPSKPEARSQWVDWTLQEAEVILGKNQQQQGAYNRMDDIFIQALRNAGKQEMVVDLKLRTCIGAKCKPAMPPRACADIQCGKAMINLCAVTAATLATADGSKLLHVG